MERYFNITGACNPQEHYMVNPDIRLAKIKKMVYAGKYCVINRGRQYGKTTTLNALENYLQSAPFCIFENLECIASFDWLLCVFL